MPRLARSVVPEAIYHVIARGNNRRVVFHDDEDFLAYRSVLLHYKQELPFLLHHYVFMSNHVHMIIRPSAQATLAAIMQGISLKYSLYYKKKYGFIGHLWQGRFKNLLIDKDGYQLICGVYIELNPVRASITKNPMDYKWSSYGAYACGERDELVDFDSLYLESGSTKAEREAAYRNLVEAWRQR